ncbi:MAG: hypothetical protein DHS20C04_04380 [Hyphococcus sp.]|nr:MAG: hypothetical protein DHS20C04_04380 [Marinicaulis sp.]
MQMEVNELRRHAKGAPDLKSDDGGSVLRPEQRSPKLSCANDHDEYAESDNVAQAFVFHKSLHSKVLSLFFIPFLFFCRVKSARKILPAVESLY